MITKKYYKLIRVSYADEGYFCLTNVGNSIGTVKIDKWWETPNSNTSPAVLEYSTDGVNWTTYTGGNGGDAVAINVDPNSNIYWRCKAGQLAFYRSRSQFIFDFDCVASGNLMSLFTDSNFASYTGNWAASNLFCNQTHLLRADFNFGAQTTVYCYDNISTYKRNDGIDSMFSGCTNLVSAPNLGNLVNSSSTSDSAQQYYTGSMNNLFRNCSSLNTIYAPNMTYDSSFVYNWVDGVAASGNFFIDSSVADSWTTYSTSGIPTGWTKVTL